MVYNYPMKANINEVKDAIFGHKEILRNTYFVKDIGVFGSIARDEDTELSDVDILVEFSKPVGFFKFIELEKYLSEIFKKRVDLVTKNALKPAIKEDILKEVVYV